MPEKLTEDQKIIRSAMDDYDLAFTAESRNRIDMVDYKNAFSTEMSIWAERVFKTSILWVVKTLSIRLFSR